MFIAILHELFLLASLRFSVVMDRHNNSQLILAGLDTGKRINAGDSI